MNYETIKQLAKDNGLRVADLCALAPKNDPFYIGRPADEAAGRWFADLWREFGYESGVHLRRVHYQIISQTPPIQRPDSQPYQNTLKDWAYLNQAAKAARYLNLVNPGLFVDRRNPEAIICTNWVAPDHEFYVDPEPSQTTDNDWKDEYGFTADKFELPELPELKRLPYDLPRLPSLDAHGYTSVQQASRPRRDMV